MKKCVKCNKEKQLDMFYKDKRCKDGLGSYCKDCHNKIVMKSKKKKPDKYKEYQKEYRKTYKANYQVNNPNYKKAMKKVAQAIKKGTLKKKPCEICGEKKVVAHHPYYRYFKPLDVMWLCASHHKLIHSEEKINSIQKSSEKISTKNQQLDRISRSINFYLDYHKVPEPSRTMIWGNLMEVFKKELKII